MSFEQRMSKRFWGLDWAKLLPWRIDDDTRVDGGSLEESEPFIRDVFPGTFNTEGRWLVEPLTEAKRRFAAEMDFFICRRRDRIVSVLIGHPSDWSTYYWRMVAMHPDFRGVGLMNALGERIVPPLRDVGVTRMEVDTCPANSAMMHFLAKLGFLVTGTMASERWGYSLRLTHHLKPDAARRFQDQFLDVPVSAISKERSQP